MNVPVQPPRPEPRPFRMWTIYDHPRDFPDFYVARLYVELNGRQYVSHTDFLLSPDLITLREALVTEKGMSACLHRRPGDDPVIVETWV